MFNWITSFFTNRINWALFVGMLVGGFFLPFLHTTLNSNILEGIVAGSVLTASSVLLTEG